MTIWIDTNILSAMLNPNKQTQELARQAMKAAAREEWFAISACVYAELLAGPGRTLEAVVSFLEDAEIPIAWQTGEDVWQLAAERFQQYAERRRADGSEPKRFLADFLIGAQATLRGGTLLTFDQRTYAAAFPELRLIGRPKAAA